MNLEFTTINVDGEKRNWKFDSVDELKAAYTAENYDLPDGDDPVIELCLNGVTLYVDTFEQLYRLLAGESR